MGLASVLVIALLLAAAPGAPVAPLQLSMEGCGPSASVDPTVENGTSDLGSSFAPGGLQQFGSNTSDVLFGGVGPFRSVGGTYATVPALASWSPRTGAVQDLTPSVLPYFPQGGIYPVVWNGSAWLIGGQRNTTTTSAPSLLFLQDGRTTDLSAEVASYFSGGWIWAAGWDGHGWLIAGNSSSGAVAIYLEGNRWTDLTPLLPDDRPGDWVQWVGWNGSGWLLGGGGIFASYDGGTMTDLLPTSPFSDGGVYAGAWGSNEWLVGGTPDGVATVVGDTVRAGPSLPDAPTGWVNAIVAVPGGWVVAGGVVLGAENVRPQMDVVPSGAPGLEARDLSGLLPTAFEGGWVQFGAWENASVPSGLLLAGIGGPDPSAGSGSGALAELTWSCAT